MIGAGDLRRAAVFHAVADSGGITAAARRIGKSAPAVHADLRRFERDMGVDLTERFGRGLRLTPAGRTMYQTIGRALAEIGRAGSHIRVDPQAALPLRIGAVSGFGRYVLAPRLLTAVAPHRAISMRTGSHEALLAALAGAEIDLLLTYRSVTSVLIESEPVTDEMLVLAHAPGTPVPDRIEEARWITYDEHEYVFARWFAQTQGSQPRTLDRHDHFDELEEALASVAAGRGFTIAPADACRAAGLSLAEAAASNMIFLCGTAARLASEDAALVRDCLSGRVARAGAAEAR